MSMSTTTGLILVDEDSPLHLTEELVHPKTQMEGLDIIDIYIYQRSSCPLFRKAKELSERLRDIVKRAKEPYEIWDKDRIHSSGFPPPYEVREKIEQLDAEFRDESRSLRAVISKIEDWSRDQKKPSSISNEVVTKEPIENHGLRIWPSRQEVECDGIKVPLKGKSWSIIAKCIANNGWATDCANRGKIDVDSDVKELNAPWKETGWKIAKHHDKKIILGKEAKRKNLSRNSPETSPKIPRKSPVKAS